MAPYSSSHLGTLHLKSAGKSQVKSRVPECLFRSELETELRAYVVWFLFLNLKEHEGWGMQSSLQVVSVDYGRNVLKGLYIIF